MKNNNEKSKNMFIIIPICIVLLVLLLAIGRIIYIKKVYISKDEVKRIVLSDTKLKEKDISFKEIDLDLGEETKKYDVEFYYNRTEYKYEIDAKTGSIIYSDFNAYKDKDSSNANSELNNSNDKAWISQQEAIDIALKDAGLKNDEVTITEVSLESLEYEVDFETKTTEYDYKIDAINKKILSKKQEPISNKLFID